MRNLSQKQITAATLCAVGAVLVTVSYSQGWLRKLFARKAKRAHNFSAGPGMQYTPVMEHAQAEFLSWHGTGMNIMEMSHRDPKGPVQAMMTEAASDVRTLLNVPSNYHILYMHGGALGQFSAVPLNLLGSKTKADYVVTGFWSQRAKQMASGFPGLREVDVRTTVTQADGSTMVAIKPVEEWGLDPDAAYVHICASETMDGLEFLEDLTLPHGLTLVADFTSTLLSRPVDISKYGLIYASGGKNVGPSGFTLVIVREDLVSSASAHPLTPEILNYHTAATSQPIPSIQNSPPTFNIYLHSLVLKHLQALGGLKVMDARAQRRANQVYSVVDSSNGFYATNALPAQRARMNVPFRIGSMHTPNVELEEKFVAMATAEGFLQLMGHPVRGGLRLTLYNAIPDESVDLVCEFMRRFQQAYAK